MSYYKVTKLNGESFHTPNVVYQLGKRVRPGPFESRELCGPGLLHASPSAPEAAQFGKWPYKLWRVEGKPFVENTDKAGFKQLTVTGEADVAECFGPNGAKVLGLIRQTERLTSDQAERLYAARSAPLSAPLYAARHAARSAARYAAFYAAQYAARSAAWYAAWYAARSAAFYAAGDALRVAREAAGDARRVAREAAGSAARYAAGAHAVEDLIGQYWYTQEHHDLLVGPWELVMDTPQ